MLERVIFNILSFSLFILIFSKLIRKNDTAYVVPISLEALGIAIGLIEILLGKYLGTFIRVITYILAILLPLAIIILEKYGFNVSEIIYLVSARMFNLFKNSKKSKTLLLNLINKYPESYNGHKLLAQTYEKEGGMRKAIDEYVKAIEINKKDYESYYRIAVLLESLGKKEESIEMLNNLIHIQPDNYEASKLLGDLLCEQENFKEAINVYMNALKYNKDNFEIYYNLGIAYNEAEKYFLEGLKVEDTEPESCYQLARIYLIRGEKEKAITYLDRAVSLDSSFAKKAAKDPIFITIQRYIPKNINEKIRKNIKMTKLELDTKKHLEDTSYIVGRISKNDIKNMNMNKEKGIDLQKEERED